MEHGLEQLNDLESQHVLSHVIPHLEYGCLPHRPRGELGGHGAQGWREREDKFVTGEGKNR